MSTPIIECQKICVENADGTKWRVRFVPFNARYGAGMGLVNNGLPLVEFYDMDYPFEYETTEEVPKADRSLAHPKVLGQFVSRYPLSTMLAFSGRTLILNGGVHKWKVDEFAMKHVVDWLAQFKTVQPPIVGYDVWGSTAREQVLVYDDTEDDPAVMVRFDANRNVQEVAVLKHIPVVDASRTTTQWESDRDQTSGTPMHDQSVVPTGDLYGYWLVEWEGYQQPARVVGSDVYLCGRSAPIRLEDVDKWIFQLTTAVGKSKIE